MAEHALFALGLIGNITSTALFLSPVPTFWGITQRRDTGSFSPVPYVFALFNCMLWAFYGLPFITQNNILIISINSVGILLELVYVIIYLVFAPMQGKVRVLLMEAASVVSVGIIVAYALTLVHKSNRHLVVGFVAVAVNTLMYTAPLGVLRQVYRTKSVEYMPFLLSLFTLINSGVWLTYGILQFDYFIIIPNGLGVLSGIAQLVVYAIYRMGFTGKVCADQGANVELGSLHGIQRAEILMEDIRK